MLQDNPSEYHGSPWAPAQPTDRKVQSQPGLLSYISEKMIQELREYYPNILKESTTSLPEERSSSI